MNATIQSIFRPRDYRVRNPWRTAGIYCCLLLIVIVGTTAGQSKGSSQIQSQYVSPTKSRWIVFSKDAALTPQSLFDQNKHLLGLGQDDRAVSTKHRLDEFGVTHDRYQQFYRGILVEGAEFIVHSEQGKVLRANGVLVQDLNLDITPRMSVSSALQKALQAVNAQSYMWDDPEEEARLKTMKADPGATYYPTGELVLTTLSDENEFVASNYVLAYRFTISSEVPYDRRLVYVDANTGEVFKSISQIETSCSSGTAYTHYNGQQQFCTLYRSGSNDYVLNDDTRLIHTRNYLGSAELTDANNVWGPYFPIDNVTYAGATAHWAAQKAHDYYSSVHSRNGVDGSGLAVNYYVNWYHMLDNASWDGSTNSINVGTQFVQRDTSGEIILTYTNGPTASLDVIGHEFTHGVTDYEADLVYSYEAGALNESFSDIFGAMVEFYIQGANGDYTIGEDVWIAGPVRSMQNPNANQDPDTYRGTYWAYGAADNGGVHTNSGVQNHWFYLLAEGGSGTNDLGWSYSVTGITKDKAARIAYKNLCDYLVSSSEYADAREGAIWAAQQIYGDPSTEATQVANAWYAVGCANSTPIPPPPTLLSPANNATGQSTTLTLSWDTVSSASTYRLQVSTESGFSTTVVDDATLTTPSRQVSGLANGTVYYWRVNASNAGGNGMWSDTRNFRTIIGAPALNSPANGVQGQPTTLTLAWNAATSATSYRLQVSTSSSFTTTIVDDATLTTTSRQVSGLSNGTKYYWRVNASNGGETGAWSSVWNFTVIPVPPILIGPSNETVTDECSITVSWQSVPGVTGYRLQVSTNSSFTGTITDVTQTGTSYLVSGVKKHYWRVASLYNGGQTSWSYTPAWWFQLQISICVCNPDACKVEAPPDDENPTVDAPTEFSLNQNYPNPFNPDTHLRFAIPRETYVTIRVYDMLGREVKTLVDGIESPGYRDVIFDAHELPAGVYVCRMQADGFTQITKMLLTK